MRGSKVGCVLCRRVSGLNYLQNRVVPVYSSGTLKTEGLVTHRLGLEEVGEAMRLAAEGGESLKVVIVP